MNKHHIITGVAMIVIAAPFVYSGLNIYAVEQMQYRWNNVEEFSFFVMSNNGMMEFCNTTPFWVDIKTFQVELFYDVNSLGTFSLDSVSMNPSSSTIQYGKFVSDKFVAAQHVFMTLDFEFDGGDIRLNPTKSYVLVTTNTPIMGFIPYVTSSQYTGFDFDSIMKGDSFDC